MIDPLHEAQIPVRDLVMRGQAALQSLPLRAIAQLRSRPAPQCDQARALEFNAGDGLAHALIVAGKQVDQDDPDVRREVTPTNEGAGTDADVARQHHAQALRKASRAATTTAASLCAVL